MDGRVARGSRVPRLLTGLHNRAALDAMVGSGRPGALVYADLDEFKRVNTAILRLADACGRDVVAEGVEDAGQLAFLVEEGCRLAQGFHLGRPQPAPVLAGSLAAGVVAERRHAVA